MRSCDLICNHVTEFVENNWLHLGCGGGGGGGFLDICQLVKVFDFQCCLMQNPPTCVGMYVIVAERLVSLEWARMGFTVLRDNRLTGLVVKASTSRVEDPGFNSGLHCWVFFQIKSHQ